MLRVLIPCSVAMLIAVDGGAGTSYSLQDPKARIAEQLATLQARERAQEATPFERYQLAALLRQLGRDDLAAPIARTLIEDPNLMPWAHYLMGQILFHRDPAAARAEYVNARRGARERNAEDLVAQAGIAVRQCEEESARPLRQRLLQSAITRGIYAALVVAALFIALGCWLTRERVAPIDSDSKH